MIRKDHIKTAKQHAQLNFHHRSTHLITPKKIYGQATESDWPVEEEYFFEAEDY